MGCHAGKDYDPRSVFTTDFVVDGDRIAFLLADDERNLHLFKYDPMGNESITDGAVVTSYEDFLVDAESRGGQKLLCVGDYHLGAHVPRFVRLKMNVLKSNREAPIAKYCNVFVTVDGGVGAVRGMIFWPLADGFVILSVFFYSSRPLRKSNLTSLGDWRCAWCQPWRTTLALTPRPSA